MLTVVTSLLLLRKCETINCYCRSAYWIHVTVCIIAGCSQHMNGLVSRATAFSLGGGIVIVLYCSQHVAAATIMRDVMSTVYWQAASARHVSSLRCFIVARHEFAYSFTCLDLGRV